MRARHLFPLSAALTLAGVFASATVARADDPTPSALAELTASEELLLHLTPATRKLGEGATALALPNEDTADLFAARVSANPIGPATPDAAESFSIPGFHQSSHLPGAMGPPVPRESLALWRELFDGLGAVAEAKFFPIKGRFLEAGRQRYECTTGLEALARTPGGEWRQIKGEVDLVWQARAGSEAWEITSWQTRLHRRAARSRSEMRDASVMGSP